MSIIQFIKSFFVKEEEPKPVWEIHWYGHVIYKGDEFHWVRYDHLGIVQMWYKECDRPRLGEQVTFLPTRDPIYADMDLPPVMHGVVTHVRHLHDGPGGSITVFDKDTIYVMGDKHKVRNGLHLGNHVSDDQFAQIQEQRKLILMGEELPFGSWIKLS